MQKLVFNQSFNSLKRKSSTSQLVEKEYLLHSKIRLIEAKAPRCMESLQRKSIFPLRGIIYKKL